MIKKVLVIMAVVIVLAVAITVFANRKTDPTTNVKITAKSQSHTSPSSSNTGGSTNKTQPKSSPPVASSNLASNASFTPKSDACKALTLANAQAIFGSNIEPLNTSDVTNSTSQNSSMSTCVFSNGLNSSSTNYEEITLVAHTSLTPVGASDNAVIFGSEKPTGVTDVQGVGQAAFWDTSKSQLNVLNNNNWYVVSLSKGNPTIPGYLTDAKSAAQIIFKQGL